VRKVLAVAALVVVGATVAAADASAADTPGCVTRGEYRSVHRGDSMSRVHRIFDTERRMSIATSGGYASQVRTYRTCSRLSSVAASFSKRPGRAWRLDAKSAVWVG
jgi:hypothetical protein